MTRPLTGTLVVSLEQAVAAPYCTARLADAGARVIKVERPGGDFARTYDDVVAGQSAYFVWTNRGKEAIELNIKDAEDRALLHNILRQADVFVQNLAPGAAERAGFGSAALRRRYPRLITCAISGYGDEGEYADMKAYDLLVQAESGLVSVNGTREGMGRVGISICDISGGMNAYAAILEALLLRAETGQGTSLKISLFDAIADWLSVPYCQQVYGGRAPGRMGIHHPSIAPYGAYACQDGLILIAIQNEREWHRFCRLVLQQPELAQRPPLATNSARVAHRDQLDAHIEARFRQSTREAMAAQLKAAGIAYGRLNSLADLAAHPQLHLCPVEVGGNDVDIIASPIRAAYAPARFGPVPAVGEHSAAIREEFGSS